MMLIFLVNLNEIYFLGLWITNSNVIVIFITEPVQCVRKKSNWFYEQWNNLPRKRLRSTQIRLSCQLIISKDRLKLDIAISNYWWCYTIASDLKFLSVIKIKTTEIILSPVQLNLLGKVSNLFNLLQSNALLQR